MRIYSSDFRLRAGLIFVFGLLIAPGNLLKGAMITPSLSSESTVQVVFRSSESAPPVGTTDGSPASTSISRTYSSLQNYSMSGESSMSIGNDSWRALASVGGFFDPPGVGAYRSTATAVGDVFDNILISNGSYFVLPVHITGGVTTSINAVSGFTGTLAAGVTVGYTCQVNPYNGANYLAGSSCGSPQLTFNGTQQVDTVMELVVPFTAGLYSTIHMSPYVQAFGGYSATGDLPFVSGQMTFSAIGDFTHTALLQAIRIYDAEGNLLTDVDVQSGSGFNYLAGAITADPGPESQVPEPSTFGLLGAGFALVGLLRRKR